jgi:hypothetical protein
MTTLPNLNPNPTGYVFLDVDGILNPFLRELNLDGWKLTEIEGFWVWTSKTVGEWFQSLVESGVQIVWATTWINSPAGLRKLECKWGLPANLPTIDRLERQPTYLDRTSCGKRPGIIRWMNAHNINTDTVPTVWVDDDLGPVDLDWAEARGVKTVKVPSLRGLSDPAQLRAIEDALGVRVEAVA